MGADEDDNTIPVIPASASLVCESALMRAQASGQPAKRVCLVPLPLLPHHSHILPMPSLTEPEAAHTKPGPLKSLHNRPPLLLGLLGALSGTISALLPERVGDALKPLGDLLFLDGTIVHPALLFAPVIGYGVWTFGGLDGARRRMVATVIVLLAAVAGWSVAVTIAVNLHSLKIAAAWLPSDALIPGIAAGAAGAAMVFLGGAMAVPVLRSVHVWAPGVAIGAIAGLLLLPAGLSSSYDLLGPLALLAIWQASVAAWFGCALAAGRSS